MYPFNLISFLENKIKAIILSKFPIFLISENLDKIYNS